MQLLLILKIKAVWCSPKTNQKTSIWGQGSGSFDSLPRTMDLIPSITVNQVQKGGLVISVCRRLDNQSHCQLHETSSLKKALDEASFNKSNSDTSKLPRGNMDSRNFVFRIEGISVILCFQSCFSNRLIWLNSYFVTKAVFKTGSLYTGLASPKLRDHLSAPAS